MTKKVLKDIPEEILRQNTRVGLEKATELPLARNRSLYQRKITLIGKFCMPYQSIVTSVIFLISIFPEYYLGYYFHCISLLRGRTRSSFTKLTCDSLFVVGVSQ